MNILITGGSGFIGQKLTSELCQQGHKVRILSRHSNYKTPEGVQVIKGDLVSSSCPFEKSVKNCDVIYHCAGEINDKSKMEALHIDATQRLLNATINEANNSGRPTHWVQLSSVGAYGPPRRGPSFDRIVTEKTPTLPAGEYETTKTISDELVVKACQDDLLTYSIIRPSNVFGQTMNNQSLRSLSTMIQKGLFFYIGKSEAIATYIHVDDVVEVLLRCGFEYQAKGEIFNVSNDCILSDLIDGIANSLNVSQPRFRIPELLVRSITQAVSKLVTIPLTQERIDALISRTRYPYNKLESLLGFKPEKPVPQFIGEVLLR